MRWDKDQSVQMRLWEKTRTNEKLLITEVYLKLRLQQNLETQKTHSAESDI